VEFFNDGGKENAKGSAAAECQCNGGEENTDDDPGVGGPPYIFFARFRIGLSIFGDL